MSSILRIYGVLILSTNNHELYSIDYPTIKNLIYKWNGNRQSDNDRVQEIANHYSNGGHVPPYISVAEIQGIHGLVCYDGEHRRNAFNQINYQNSIIIDIIPNATRKDVRNAFHHINKMVPLSQMYLDEDEEHRVKGDIQYYVRQFKEKYNKMFSTSSRCVRPYTNQDILIDDIYSIWSDFNTQTNNSIGKEITVHDIMKSIDTLNIQYIHTNNLYIDHLPNKAKERCRYYNLWIFINGRNLPKNEIKQILQMYYSDSKHTIQPTFKG